MSKRKTTDLLCYIHHVSPQKANKSFNVQLQTSDSEGKTFRAICFDKEKFNVFQSKHVSGEPVKIKKAVVQETQNENFASILINKSSVITDIEPIQVNFEKLEPTYSYVDINEDHEIGNLICIKGKLDLTHASETTVLHGMRNLKVMNDAFVTDKSRSIYFTMWEEWIDFFRDSDR